jgi:hypothetical protein
MQRDKAPLSPTVSMAAPINSGSSLHHVKTKTELPGLSGNSYDLYWTSVRFEPWPRRGLLLYHVVVLSPFMIMSRKSCNRSRSLLSTSFQIHYYLIIYHSPLYNTRNRSLSKPIIIIIIIIIIIYQLKALSRSTLDAGIAQLV